MKIRGVFEYMAQGEQMRCYSRFESTGIKLEDGKMLWRKISKDGRQTNIFAEQFIPNVPWAQGKWFLKLNAGTILEKHPELKVETDRSKTMTDSEYIQWLKESFEC
jgi:hypothetical protein